MPKKRRTEGQIRRRPSAAGRGTAPAEVNADDLDEFRRLLVQIGAPAEVIQALDGPGGPAAVVERLVESGLLPSPDETFTKVIEDFASVAGPRAQALEAELLGVHLLTLLQADTPESDVLVMLADLIANAEKHATPEALAALRIVAALGPAPARDDASAAADRLVAAGLADPPWVGTLGAPEFVAAFGYGDDLGAQESIAITFRYGRKQHAVAALIDHDLGGGVKDCWVTDRASRIRRAYQQAARQMGIEFREYSAAQAHAVLDRALGNEPCPVTPDQVEDVRLHLAVLRGRTALLRADGRAPAPPRPRRAPVVPTVHRLRVTLRGPQPPIWRGLELPSDATMTDLHVAVQKAFGWENQHLWAVETGTGGPVGARKALRDVARRARARLTYRYDFGDDWDHDVVVEGVVEAEPGVAYPRCVAGERAGPPEDCGGIWGYQEMLEILADPHHDEHANMLDWLGLTAATDFDPAAFDLAAVNEALSRNGRVLVTA